MSKGVRAMSRRAQKALERELWGPAPKTKRAPRPRQEPEEKPYLGFCYRAPPDLASRPGACSWCCGQVWPARMPHICQHCGVIYPVVQSEHDSGMAPEEEVARALAAYLARWGEGGFRFDDHAEDEDGNPIWREVAARCREELLETAARFGARTIWQKLE